MNAENRMANRSDQEKLDLLFSYVPLIAEEQSLNKLLILIADLARELVSADRCSLWLLSSDKKELWTKVAHNVGTIRIPAQDGFVGYSLLHDESLLIPDAYEDSRFEKSVDQKTNYRTRSVMTVPFKDSAGKPMGVFQAINKMDGTAFDEENLKFLQLTAVYSAKSLEATMLFHELEKAQEEISVILGTVAECRSLETGNHVKRVSEMCYKLAKYLGLPETECKQIKLASSMHDLGKVGIPDNILNKPGRFSDQEYEIMKKHVTLGYDMLKYSKRKVLLLASEIALNHHERFDGKGYPNGVAGENIPLSGRICAVADVFDALTNERCYKKPWEREKVIQLFKEERHKQFQAELVDILLTHLDEFYEINNRMPG